MFPKSYQMDFFGGIFCYEIVVYHDFFAVSDHIVPFLVT